MEDRKKILMLLAALDLTQNELASRLGTSRQNLNRKMQLNYFTSNDFKEIAKALGVEFECYFILKDGTKI